MNALMRKSVLRFNKPSSLRSMAYYDVKDKKPWHIDTIPAFCINLERRPDRWIEFSKQPGVPPNVKRFKGVDGSTLDIMKDDRIPLITKRNILHKSRRSHEELNTAGGVGCALSHIAAWEWIVQNQAPVTLIFEDDAKVPQNFTDYMNATIDRSPVLKDPSQWELLTLTPTPYAKDTDLHTVNSFIGFQCYLITLPCAKRFLSEAYTLHMHIDLWTAIFKQVHGLEILCLPKFTVSQRSSKTDIQDLNGCKLCDLSPTYYKTHTMVRNEEYLLLKAVEIALAAGFLYAIYKYSFPSK